MIELKLENFQFGFQTPLTAPVDLEIKGNEFICLLGRNGSGKSTFLKTLLGILPALAGNLWIDGRIISKNIDLSTRVSGVLTDRDFDFYLRCKELIGLGRIPHTGLMGSLTSKDEQIVERVISHLKLQEIEDKYVNELSDGQLQKVLIARSLVQDTPCLILDEPSVFLDYQTKKEIFDFLRHLVHIGQKMILVSTHDLDLVVEKATKLLVIDNNSEMKVYNQFRFTKDEVLSIMSTT